jgi:hypothetical protein
MRCFRRMLRQFLNNPLLGPKNKPAHPAVRLPVIQPRKHMHNSLQQKDLTAER